MFALHFSQHFDGFETNIAQKDVLLSNYRQNIYDRDSQRLNTLKTTFQDIFVMENI